MEYIKLAIVTDDKAYGQALSRALLIGNRGFDLSRFSCGAFCRRWREAGDLFAGEYDLILWDQEGVEQLAGGRIVRLSEHMSEAGGSKGRRVLYKYSPAGPMVGEIFRFYEELTGRRPPRARPSGVHVFVLASWQGGAGCTSLCMSLGQELIRSWRRRVLYLSLEGIESTAAYMEVPAGMRGAGEFLYHLEADGSKGVPFLEGYLVRSEAGAEAFAPSDGGNPLSLATGEEMGRLLAALMSSGRFDCVLIDAGTAAGEAAREALASADRIFLVSSAEEPEREKRYRAFLKYGTERDCSDRIIRVRNRQDGEEGREDGREDGGEVGTVRISSARKSGPALITEGRFAKDIHRMAELCYNKS